MNDNLKKTAIIAILFAVMIGLIPANIAWAGPLWQTLPTRGPSRTPTNSSTATATPQTPTVTPLFTSTFTVTLPPGVTATVTSFPTATITQAPTNQTTVLTGTTAAATATSSSTPAVTITPGVVITSDTASTLSAAATQSLPTTGSQEPVKTSATVPPGFIPTAPTQAASDEAPLFATKTPTSLVKVDGLEKSNLPGVLLGLVLLIFLGIVVKIILDHGRKPQ